MALASRPLPPTAFAMKVPSDWESPPNPSATRPLPAKAFAMKVPSDWESPPVPSPPTPQDPCPVDKPTPPDLSKKPFDLEPSTVNLPDDFQIPALHDLPSEPPSFSFHFTPSAPSVAHNLKSPPGDPDTPMDVDDVYLPGRVAPGDPPSVDQSTRTPISQPFLNGPFAGKYPSRNYDYIIDDVSVLYCPT